MVIPGDSFDRFQETSLPPKAAFYDDLKDADCTDAYYERAQAIWDGFGIKSLYEFQSLYLFVVSVCVFIYFH